jgi:hypothetical protein
MRSGGMSSLSPDAGKSPVLLVSDKAGAAVLTSLFNAAELPVSTIVLPKRRWQRSVLETFQKGGGILVLVPTRRFGTDIVEMVSEIHRKGGDTVVWASGAAPKDSAPSEQWLIEKMLQQKGAICTTDVSTVIPLIHLLRERSNIQSPVRNRPVRVIGAKSSVSIRLQNFLVQKAIPRKCTANALPLYVNDEGQITLTETSCGTNLGDPLAVASAVSLLALMDPGEFREKRLESHSDRELSLILAPPQRLLSEITSKKIVAAYGMRLPKEQLCQSPSEAARFAASLDGPVVMKLVKPQLENKRLNGAVIENVVGTAAVRRAAQSLEGLGISLGPPPPLGILVSEQVSRPERVWLKMLDHPEFGRLLMGGSGDGKDNLPAFVFSTPASEAEVFRGMRSLGICRSDRTARTLSKGISTFAKVVDHLGPRIERAEIHPMVVGESDDAPVVLDALFAIADG